jgi:hypothetical protein
MTGAMVRLRLVALTAIFVAGCLSAKVITAPTKPGKSGATKAEPVHPGVVRYSTEGLDVNVENRRSEAYEEMHKACEGEFHVDAEGPELKDGRVVEAPDSGAEPGDYWYIEFRCAAP